MILHCTPPYRLHVPNPALGYLKGFLQAKEIEVKNIHWNLILSRKLLLFQRMLEKYAENTRFFSVFHTLYMCRHLLREDSKDDTPTPLDLVYSSIYSRDELAEMAHSIRDDIDHYIQQNNLHEAALSGVTMNIFQWLMSSYLIRRLKELNPETKIVIGGITTESQGLEFMKVFELADFAIWGEGEYPLFYLARALEEKADLKHVPNLIYRDDSKIHLTEAMHEHSNLDSFPFADHSDYFNTLKKYKSFQVPVRIPIWGSRSCPWNKCRFCVLNRGYTYRTRSPENIVEEIEYQSERHNVDNFIFVDTEVPGNLKRFKNLLRLLIQSSANRKRKYDFHAEISPIFINPETAHYMRLASFTQIQVGFEAMTDSLLKKMQKRHRFAHNIQALKLGNQYGIDISGLNIIREIPTEIEEDILESCTNVKFLRFFLNKFYLEPGFLRLWKGAPFYDDVSEEERKEWKDSPFWTEVKPFDLVSESNKREFFGFYKSSHDRLWDDFERLLKFYVQQDRSHEWTEYPDGSIVEEKGLRTCRYRFNRDETDLLIFCDSIKAFSEVKERFPHLSEDKLLEMLGSMKDTGIMYYDKDLRWIISVFEAAKRKVLVAPGEAESPHTS